MCLNGVDVTMPVSMPAQILDKIMDKNEELKQKLLDRFDYPSAEIESTVTQLLSLSDAGKENLTCLLETGTLPDVNKFGLSLKEMKKQKPDMSDIAILIVFDQMISHLNR